MTMLLTILGLIIITIPFLLTFCFKNRLSGFVSVLGGVIIWHLFVGFLTQFFHVFKYPVLITIHSLIAGAVLLFIFYKFKNISFKFKINWLVVVGFLIILFQLWSVHFSYSGIINSISGPQLAFKNYYPYPYFSDEWVGISFANYSISNNSLATLNPLALGLPIKNFSNIFICFFSIISEIFLVLNLTPLTAYVFLSIFFGMLICLLVFLFLRANNINSFIALLATLCLPYIVNGANIPGLWYLIPFTGGLVLFLISLICFSYYKQTLFFLTSFFAILLYPPLVIFILPVFLGSILLDKAMTNKKKIKIMLIGFVTLALAVALIFYSQRNNINLLTHFVLNSFWHLNLDGGIPTFYVWRIIPALLIPFSIIGLWQSLNRKYLPLTIASLVGIAFWVFYSFSRYYFFIDYARVVVTSALLLIILSGVGANYLLHYFLKKYNKSFSAKFVLIFKVALLLLFFLFSLAYTNRLNWQNLKLKVSGREDVYISPSSPANIYLHKDDLRLFENISSTRFLSIPWKGLVIGVATGNYPLHSKESIVSNNFLNYNEFMRKNCVEKTKLAQKMKIDFVYLAPFTCDNFVEQGRSQEGLVLYKFIYEN